MARNPDMIKLHRQISLKFISQPMVPWTTGKRVTRIVVNNRSYPLNQVVFYSYQVIYNLGFHVLIWTSPQNGKQSLGVDDLPVDTIRWEKKKKNKYAIIMEFGIRQTAHGCKYPNNNNNNKF